MKKKTNRGLSSTVAAQSTSFGNHRMSEPRRIEGRWWLPSNPEEEFFGTLGQDARGNLTLTTKEMRSLSMGEIFADSEWGAVQPVICGSDPANKPLTLLHCTQHGGRRSMGMMTRDFGVGFAVRGLGASSQEEVRFTRVLTDFTYLQAWLNLSCLQQTEEQDGTTCLRFRYPENIPLTLADGTRVIIRAHLSYGFGLREGRTFSYSEQRLFELQFPRPLGISEILDRTRSFRWLLTLLIGRPIHLTKLEALLPNECDDTEPEEHAEILGFNLDPVETSKPPLPNDMLATYAEVQSNFAELLNKWQSYHDKVDDVLNLYFSVRFNQKLYSNHRFLFLAQALEVYHSVTADSAVTHTAEFRARLKRVLSSVSEDDRKWVGDSLRFANKKTLAQRLDEILARHPIEASHILGNMPDFADRIRHTRNYYTHFDERMKKRGKIAEDAELILLTEQMQRLLEVCLLKDLGLDRAVRKVVGKAMPKVVMLDLD